jgi:phosphohistidine phosphatase
MMEMELTLLRHGIPVDPSEWDDTDASRPLISEGRVQTRAVIVTLMEAGRLPAFGQPGGPDVIWSSPYLRTEQTAEIAAEVLAAGSGDPSMEAKRWLRVTPALASGSDLIRSLPAFAASRWPRHLMIVGHQPDLGNLVCRLTGAPIGRYALGRAGSARLKGEFAPGGMRLEWLYTADEALKLAE